MKPYPIFLINLIDRHCIVIGGGREAQHKVAGLLDCEATVTVIAPTLTPELRKMAAAGSFIWLQRSYQIGDLRGAFLVIAERADPQTNAQIWQEAESEGVLVNVMDDVSHCNFVAGSVIRQGKLVTAISTSGAAPALSVRLRQQLEAELGPEYALFLEWMQALRPEIAREIPDFEERRKRWYELVDSDLLHLLKDGHIGTARERMAEITGIELSPEQLA
ncbi:MAG: bifunctional precorrin-2 dehydrogenase/sirohydrochlorin ferrochelatase [Candidatus Promineifilaceae bacterium]|nr:bifunctional precorrin-2 dehydrogenase/sirohydrochlorin ferrochelatase [Candidatus Promineifilaceae bacterium]